jgi:hypothetical protein
MRFIVLVLAALLFSGCGVEFLDNGINTVQQVEAFIGQTLPTSATEVQFEAQGFTDTFIRLRFSAPSAEVEQFLDGLGITSLDGAVDAASFFQESSLTWWQPQDAAAYVSGALARAEVNRFYRVLVDQAADDVWTVYLVAFSQ